MVRGISDYLLAQLHVSLLYCNMSFHFLLLQIVENLPGSNHQKRTEKAKVIDRVYFGNGHVEKESHLITK